MTAMEFAMRHGLLIIPTGSRFIVDPPVMNTDADYAVFGTGEYATSLTQDGWEAGGSDAGNGGDGFHTFRKGDENIILIHDDALWLAFTTATAVAKLMNLKDKADRVELFQTMDHLWPGTPANKAHKALAAGLDLGLMA